jgi:hypothetical protein
VDEVEPDSPRFGENDVIFTKERKEAARARILRKLSTKVGQRAPAGNAGPEREPTSLEKRLILALGLQNVHELDELLAKPPDPTVELENGPPDETYGLLEREYAEQDRALEKERSSKARTRKPR